MPVSGRTGFVTVSGDTVCAYEWSYESTLTDADENRIEVTTFCSSAREYITEDVEAEVESSIDYSLYEPVDISLLGSKQPVVVGNASCSYTIVDAICTGFSCTNPIEGALTADVNWEKTESA